MTHKLSELKIKDCRHHPRGSVRRASGFVLTAMEQFRKCRSRHYFRIRDDTSEMLAVPVSSFSLCKQQFHYINIQINISSLRIARDAPDPQESNSP